MKVCFLAGTLGRGGAERQLVFMLRALKNAGIQAKLLCLTKGEALEEEIRGLGIEIRSIDTRRGRLLTLRHIVKELRREPVDVVQSSHFYTNIYASIAGLMNGIASIGAVRSDLAFELASNGIYGKYQLTMPRHLIANSKIAVERAVSLGIDRDRIDLVKNVVACGTQQKDLDNCTANPTRILFVGRLGEEKRPELFVKLAYELVNTLPDRQLKFQIVGDGPLRPKLETLARGYGLAPDIFSLDGERSEMRDVYSLADILILTSKHEGTPNVVLEALSNSIPVVATSVGGVPEILNNKMGFVVDPMDFRGLLNATAELIVNRDIRTTLGTNGRQYVRENHSLTYLEERLSGIYSRLLGSRHYARC